MEADRNVAFGGLPPNVPQLRGATPHHTRQIAGPMDRPPDGHPDADWLERHRHGSEMGRRVAEHDWSSTPLGPPERWPIGLRTAVELCLASRFPMLLVWGPDLIKVYNDAYAVMLGPDKHPRALGAPAADIWPEVWDQIGPLFDAVMTTGVATWAEHERLDVTRDGYLEECYFTFSYSPITDGAGRVGGVLDTVAETTVQVLNERRLACFGDLSRELVQARQVTDVCIRAVRALARAGDDLTTAELHLRAGDDLVLVASNHRDPARVATASLVREVLDAGTATVLDGPSDPTRPALRFALPVGDREAGGVLVLGLNPRRPFDEAYRDFAELLGSTIGAALRNEHQRSVELGEQRRISETLQGAMLVPASDIPTVAARYLPAVGNLSVGGDWYDVISLRDGRRALVVGDCVGHGLAAATAMGQLRSASRALLLEGRSPSEVLEAMDRFSRSVDGARCATMACAVVDVEADTVVYSLAGHPPPLVVAPTGSTWLDGGRGAPLGVVEAARQEAAVQLAEGDLLVLYSDGLVERRHEDIDVGLDRLRRAAEGLADQTVQEVADALLHALRDPDGRDDVALVVKRIAHRA